MIANNRMPKNILESYILISTCFVLSYCLIKENIVYNNLPLSSVYEAREYGARAYRRFLDSTANATSTERMNVYEDYFMECNALGDQRSNQVSTLVQNVNLTADSKLLLTLGFGSYVVRFLALDEKLFNEGFRQLCEKYEMQLQCQLGFGESRTAVLWRVEDLKNLDGNLRIILERQCPNPDADNTVYHCFSRNVREYTEPCFGEMLAYNYTRYSAGRRIARIHIRAVKTVTKLSLNKDLENDDDQFLSLKEHIQTVFKRALREIAETEGEKCEALEKVLKCVLPRVGERCGKEAANIMKLSILIGYLTNQRREPLSSQFKGFNVESSRKCLKLHPNIE